MGTSIAELHQDESRRNSEFPITREISYFAHAGVCPLPERVARAVCDYSGDSSRENQENSWPVGQIEKTRKLAADLLKSASGEIAFVGPTSLALSFIASGLEFQAGDNIIVYREDYPSNVYPWQALREKGVEVRYLKTEKLGQIHLEDIEVQIDQRTKLVALASCHFISGFRIDYERIGSFLREKGILFSLDAIQTVGAFPIRAQSVDFLAADAHKWLLGPCAAGILFVNECAQERLRPPVYGWHNVACPDFVAQDELIYSRGARRYEAGTFNLLGLAGLEASLELLEEFAIENIAEELLRKRRWLVPALQAKDYTVLNADLPERNQSGITSFYREGKDLRETFEALNKNKIQVSLRRDRSGRDYLRVSPHFYNTDEELEKLLHFL